MQRLRQLGPLTDQRPSDLLRCMERILGRSIEGDEIGQEEFLYRLPAQTQLIVRSQADLFTVEQPAQMADGQASVPVMHDVSANFANTHAEASREHEIISLASLHQQLSKLTASNDIISAEMTEINGRLHIPAIIVHGVSLVQIPLPVVARGCTAASMRMVFAGTIWSGASGNKCADGCRKAGNTRSGR